jgi:hypothetical protein
LVNAYEVDSSDPGPRRDYPSNIEEIRFASMIIMVRRKGIHPLWFKRMKTQANKAPNEDPFFRSGNYQGVRSYKGGRKWAGIITVPPLNLYLVFTVRCRGSFELMGKKADCEK